MRSNNPLSLLHLIISVDNGSDIEQFFIVCLFISDGIAQILRRVRPSFIFCDSDVLESVNEIVTDIGLNVKLFSVDKEVNGFDAIDSLLKETGNEEEFV